MQQVIDIFTRFPLDKMAAILADDIFKCIFLNENDRIRIQISLKFVARSPIDHKPALVQVMASRRIGDKPLSKPMLTQFTYAYMRHGGVGAGVGDGIGGLGGWGDELI